MYLEHFGLREFPFSITPDTSFFFESAVSQKALNTLLVAARSGEGFMKITGEVGTGKTLLCRQLLRTLGPEFETAYFPNPSLTPMGLLLALADELDADTSELATAPEPQHQHVLLKALLQRLLTLTIENKRVLLCLDEVQAMPIETLEALRLLTNLETEKRKLLQVVIFGQPELDERLSHVSIRQLKQRITFEHRLGPLTKPEMALYLDHRMWMAGWDGASVFTPWGRWLMRLRTRGYPRLINIVAHKSLICAYGRGLKTVGLREVGAAVADTASVLGKPWRWAAAGMAGIAGLGYLIVTWARHT